VQWQLLKAVVASPAALACGQKRLGVANYDKKVTSWWNREVKNPTRAKEVTYKAWFRNKAESSLHSRYAEAQMCAALKLKNSKIRSYENYGHKLDTITGKQTKCSGKPNDARAKKYDIA